MKGTEAETHALPVELDTIKDASPAPWRLHEGGASVIDADGLVVASCGFMPKKSIFEERANARLIVELPRMLRAIKDAVEWIEDDRFDDDYIAEGWYHQMILVLHNLGIRPAVSKEE